MATRDQVTPQQVNQKTDQVPMHKRIAMGEALDGKSLARKEQEKRSKSKQKP